MKSCPVSTYTNGINGTIDVVAQGRAIASVA
jgi:hypothetical protein